MDRVSTQVKILLVTVSILAMVQPVSALTYREKQELLANLQLIFYADRGQYIVSRVVMARGSEWYVEYRSHR